MEVNKILTSLPVKPVQPHPGFQRQRPAEGDRRPVEKNQPGAFFRASVQEPRTVIDYRPILQENQARKEAENRSSDKQTPEDDIPTLTNPEEENEPKGLPETDGNDTSKTAVPPGETKSDGTKMKNSEKETVRKLQKRDAEVRAHEQSHVAAAGGYAQGGVHFEFDNGPDGKRYAVGGHVNIDVSEEATPEATISKMRVVRRAAMAPASPSGADHSIAQSASSKELKASQQLMARMRDKMERNRPKPAEDDQVDIAPHAEQQAGQPDLPPPLIESPDIKPPNSPSGDMNPRGTLDALASPAAKGVSAYRHAMALGAHHPTATFHIQA